MTNATPMFPLAPEHRDLGIVGLAQAGTPARTIAAAVEVELLTDVGTEPILPPRTFRIENIEWDTEGELAEQLRAKEQSPSPAGNTVSCLTPTAPNIKR